MGAAKGNNYATGNKGGGRKTDFKLEYVELGFNYALMGATDAELATFFNVSERTINVWKKKHKEFYSALKKGKNVADAKVASKLYSRAIGYDYDENHVEKKGRKILKRKIIKKHMAPDTTAGIFWLKNRQPDKWRDKQELALNGELTLKSELENLSDDELEIIINGGKLETSKDKEA